MPELDRRDFLKIVGLGAGAAAASGCSDPIEKLVPYVIQPESVTPGIATTYASTCQECSLACGLHVRTREGRPIKVEGNPKHPINQGALCARGQMGVARTYHPDRYDGPKKGGEATTWDEALASLKGKLGQGTVVLGAPVGPSLSGVIDAFVSGIGGQRVVYEPFAFDALRAATEKVFGVATLPIFDLSGADLVVDFGFDVLDSGTSPVEHSRQLADARDTDKHADGGARLVSISPRMNLTTSTADEWIPAKPGSEGLVALALAQAVAKKKGASGAVQAALDGASAGDAASKAGVDQGTLDALADRLAQAKHAVALPPGVALSSSVAVSANAAVLLLNAVLGAVGNAVTLPAPGGAAAATYAELEKLVAAMNSGAVKTLLIHGSNPVYSLPASLGFADALAKVDTVVSFASMKDETSEAAALVLPDHSPMESWGDAEPRPGVRSIVQPTIRPLLDTRALGDTLLELGRAAGATMPSGSFHDVVKASWAGTDWVTALSNGGLFGAVQTVPAEVQRASGIAPGAPSFEGSGDYTLVAFPHSYQTDGSGANLPWAQEVPDPVTKISWNTWVEMSFATAEKLGVEFGDVVSVTAAGGTFEASAFPRGGVRDDVIAVPIGQGHTVGFYASMETEVDQAASAPGQARGANVLSVLSGKAGEAGSRVFLGSKASVEKTGRFRRLALSQWTDNQRGRGLAPTVSLLALAEGTHSVAHFEAHAAESGGEHGEGHGDDHGDDAGHGGGEHHLLPFDPAFDAKPGQPYRWGMVIDNDRCNGCSACITACYTENNVAIVGEAQAIKHREMTWLRIERYVGDGDREGGADRRPYPNRERLGETDVRHLPMPCQHCGAAPCEAVCPVIGTYHTDEGLNGMVYNRCVGTRYCANNCVYKVRRFNYWDYGNQNWPGMLGMMLNPDVTVRQQGVMEKCSFCVQRIEEARQPAKDAGRPIADGEVVTACQQTCPTNAITFGNWREDGARINQLVKDNARNYNVLHVLNARPAVSYLAQVTRDDQEGHHS